MVNLKDMEQQITRTYYKDGLMELMAGAYLFIVGGLLAVESDIVPFTILIVPALKPLMDRLKNRFVYPRIGYVELKEDESAGWGVLKGLLIAMLLLALAAIIAIVLMGKSQGGSFWLNRLVPLGVGLLTAMGPLYAGSHLGLKRWYIFAVLFALSGIIGPFLNLGNVYVTIGYQFSSLGVLLLLMGIVIFIRFLRSHPPLEEGGGHS